MTGSPLTGVVTVTVGDAEYRLFFGTTAIAEVQAEHGMDFLAALDGAAQSGGLDGLPVALVNAIIAAALRRFHATDLRADPYLVDDIILSNAAVMGDLMAVAFGPGDGSGDAAGNAKAAGTGKAA